MQSTLSSWCAYVACVSVGKCCARRIDTFKLLGRRDAGAAATADRTTMRAIKFYCECSDRCCMHMHACSNFSVMNLHQDRSGEQRTRCECGVCCSLGGSVVGLGRSHCRMCSHRCNIFSDVCKSSPSHMHTILCFCLASTTSINFHWRRA